MSATLAIPTPASADDPSPYLDDSGRYTFEERAADLVSRMTRAEKLPQFKAERQYQNANLTNNNGIAPAIPRLGVQAYNWWNEALHGIARAHGNSTNPAQQLINGGEATEFPTGLGVAATWNRELVRIGMAAASDEARAMNNHTDTVAPAAKHKGLTYWSPTINLNRDPRWGRAEESYGEDPYLTGQIGGQFTIGMQGGDSTYLKTAVTPKHYMANNSETNRHIGSSDLTESELREYYTAPFATLMGEYGAKSMMTAYNRANGVPMSASREFIETLTRRTWGFDGVVTSDCGAINDVYRNNNYRWTPRESDHFVTQQEAVSYTLKAGTELDCMDNAYPNTTQGLEPAYGNGLVTEEDIDVALTRAFKVRMEFGEFDSPDKVPWTGADYTLATQISAQDHLAASRQMSDEAVVMLKNDRPNGSATPVLPLSAASAQNIVVVGPMAQYEVHGDYSPSATKEHFTPLQGLEEMADATGATLTYIPGINGVPNTDWRRRKPNLGRSNVVARYLNAGGTEIGRVTSPELQASGDFDGWQGSSGNAGTFTTRGAWGASFGIPLQVTNPGTNSIDDIARVQYQFANTGTADLLPNSRFDIHLNSRTGPIIAQLPLGTSITNNNYAALSFDVATALPGGLTPDMRLYAVWRTDYYQPTFTPAQEAQVAAADVVVAVTGTIAMSGGEGITATVPWVTNNPTDSAEEEDRSNLDLPRGQDLLIQHVASLNPRTVAWIQAVGQINVEPFKDDVAALFWSTYNGMYQGHALGDILWGKANPSAKLPMTYYTDIDDLPNAKDYTLTPTGGRPGRTYQYFTGDVSYPFGYGLSYSSFEYSNLRLSATSADVDDTITATVDVRNTSDRDGQEVVQLYVTSPNAADPLRPDQQLKGFEKVLIEAGTLKQVSIQLKASDLWFWDDDADGRTYDVGTWGLRVAPSSDPTEGVSTTFALTGTLDPALDVVAAIPDGVVLNTQVPGNVIHANLSATRTDQSFYDLADPSVKVTYTSAKPAIATVDTTGTVRPAGPGVTHITATVTADGGTKSTTFPVVVHAGALTVTNPDASQTTLFARQASFPDRTVDLAAARAGVRLSGGVIPADDAATYTYYLALGENDGNSSDTPWVSEAGITRPAGPGATVTADGVLTVERAGRVRVTMVATVAGTKYAKTATITTLPTPVSGRPVVDSSGFVTSGLGVVDDGAVPVAQSLFAFLRGVGASGQV
ncbi:MAG: glycoside hydrolase family 3 C-terminal domain-containing protein, partial [Bifidobacteriaceae bacterium]|nr:glycoside hydrolase family 3 C-terminal domain-containing protein [Bifidobacteriaceae bacterium]